MAKMSKEQVIAQLEILKISYDEKMSYAELLALIPKGTLTVREATVEETKANAAKIDKDGPDPMKINRMLVSKEPDVVVPQVPLGNATINDHECRLWAIEIKLGLR